MKTRDRIKATSIALFNEKGATNVSTVQISEVMGISPGNLYYYFTNKEHIIRSIWEEDMVLESDHVYENLGVDDPESSLTTLVNQLIQYGMKYPFFYTEQYTLFKNDPLLQQLYQARWEKGVEIVTDKFVLWQEMGYMRPSSREWKKRLVGYFMSAGPAFLRSNLSIHPEYTLEEALRAAGNGVLLVVSGDFVDDICEKMLAQLKS
jgi:AcrR family transcriptional regulator